MLSGKDVISQFPAATATAFTSCYASPPWPTLSRLEL